MSGGRRRFGSGGSPYAAPANPPSGTREFHMRDPGGNLLQFYGPHIAGSAGAA